MTAIYQSMLADAQHALKTKTVHSEIIWALNPTNNVRFIIYCHTFRFLCLDQITEALRRFGVSDTSVSLIVVRVGPQMDAGSVEQQMKGVINGTLTSMEELSGVTDWSALKKVRRWSQNVLPDAEVVAVLQT